MVDDEFIHLTGHFYMTEMKYRIQLGLVNRKRLYSLILFSGIDVSGHEETNTLVPFIDSNYFIFEYGDISSGERLIDSQYLKCIKV